MLFDVMRGIELTKFELVIGLLGVYSGSRAALAHLPHPAFGTL